MTILTSRMTKSHCLLIPPQRHRGKQCACMLSCIWLLTTPWTVAHQAPLSMGFSRQEYWSGLPFPPPEDCPNPGIKSMSPALQAASHHWSTWEAPAIRRHAVYLWLWHSLALWSWAGHLSLWIFPASCAEWEQLHRVGLTKEGDRAADTSWTPVGSDGVRESWAQGPEYTGSGYSYSLAESTALLGGHPPLPFPFSSKNPRPWICFQGTKLKTTNFQQHNESKLIYAIFLLKGRLWAIYYWTTYHGQWGRFLKPVTTAFHCLQEPGERSLSRLAGEVPPLTPGPGFCFSVEEGIFHLGLDALVLQWLTCDYIRQWNHGRVPWGALF